MLHPDITKFIESLDSKKLSEARKDILKQLAKVIKHKLDEDEKAELLFVCSHNARRSAYAEVWATAMAHYFNNSQIKSYSCGTEATHTHPQVIHTLRLQGFKIAKPVQQNNPTYAVGFSSVHPDKELFSKDMHHQTLSAIEPIAAMVCSEASESCPVIPKAIARIAVPYEDPRVFDEHPDKEQVYIKTSKLIATELKYLFKKVSQS